MPKDPKDTEVSKDEIIWTAHDPVAEEALRAVELMDAERKPRCRTIGELRSAMMKLIDLRYSGIAPAGVCLAELNRRYGGVCQALTQGLTPRDVVMDLISQRKLLARKTRNSFVVAPVERHLAHMRAFPATSADEIEIKMREEAAVFERAFPVPSKARKPKTPSIKYTDSEKG